MPTSLVHVMASRSTLEYAPPMPELNREVFVNLWKATKSQQRPDDEGLALFQKYMIMHEDMHAHFDRLEQDPAAPLEVDGENLLLHFTFAAATEKSLET